MSTFHKLDTLLNREVERWFFNFLLKLSRLRLSEQGDPFSQREDCIYQC